jgi:glycerol uptake facilitator-like aquaporin
MEGSDFLIYFVEAIGTFIFVSVILFVGADNPIAVGVALTAVIYFACKISKACFNPVVSMAVWLNDGMENKHFLFYILAEIIGGYLAYKMYTFANKHSEHYLGKYYL